MGPVGDQCEMSMIDILAANTQVVWNMNTCFWEPGWCSGYIPTLEVTFRSSTHILASGSNSSFHSLQSLEGTFINHHSNVILTK